MVRSTLNITSSSVWLLILVIVVIRSVSLRKESLRLLPALSSASVASRVLLLRL